LPSAGVLNALALELTDKLQVSLYQLAKPPVCPSQDADNGQGTAGKASLPARQTPETTEKVIAQAALLADAWAFEHPWLLCFSTFLWLLACLRSSTQSSFGCSRRRPKVLSQNWKSTGDDWQRVPTGHLQKVKF
jgi:hypothetical protein